MASNNETPHASDDVIVECSECGRRFAGPGLHGERCPECKAEMQEIGQARPNERLDEPVVEVFLADSWVQAEMIREHLESQGLFVAFKTSMPWAVLTFTVERVGAVSILALESEADQVRALIQEYLEQIQTDGDSDEDEGEDTT
jgi:hypothetical protein